MKEETFIVVASAHSGLVVGDVVRPRIRVTFSPDSILGRGLVVRIETDPALAGLHSVVGLTSRIGSVLSVSHLEKCGAETTMIEREENVDFLDKTFSHYYSSREYFDALDMMIK